MHIRGRLAAVAAVAAIALSGTARAAEPNVVIQNDSLKVTYYSYCGRIDLTRLPSGETFAPKVALPRGRGQAKAVAVSDPALGNGQAIEITYPDGGWDRVSLFPQSPFVFVRAGLENKANEPKVLNLVPLLSTPLDLGSPAKDVKTIGTGGLLPPEKNPGSYAWLAVAEPQSRCGVVGGWLTHDRASGVIFTKVEENRVAVEARLDYGRLWIAPGQTAETETFALGYFGDARLGLEAWADAVAATYQIKLPPQPVGYCTWYSDKHAGACDEKHLAELAEVAARELKPFGFGFIQIDDQWQDGVSKNGPKKNFTQAASKGPYPSGMKPTAENLKRLGLTPGIWFMPFAGTHTDPFFKDHQEWFVKRQDGSPYETAWGGTCLDMTQAGAREHVRSFVSRIAHDWGYQLFKMDGLWTGSATKQIYVNTGYKDDGIGDAVFSDPKKSNLEVYRSGLRLVREAAGKDVFLLGCCASQNMRSYGGAIGLVDAMRIGPDTGGNAGGAIFGARQYFLHGRIWYNDPDCVGVRAKVPLDQARRWASWVAVSGQLYYDSDWIPDLPPDRIDLLRRTMLPHGKTARPVDYFDTDKPQIWLVTDNSKQPRRDVVGLFNWSGSAISVDESLARLGLPEGTYVGYDFWADAPIPAFSGRLKTTVAANACQILAIRPVSDRPQVLSTSRHVTQGMVDVLEEKWDDAAKTLSGRSAVVANDPYELRIVAKGSPTAVEVSSADLAAGVKITPEAKDGLIRVRIESPTSREIAWTLRF